MERIKIGQIGMEHDHAGAILMTLKKLTDVFELVGYAVPEGEKNCHVRACEGVREMSVEELLAVPGLQAVAVETYELDLTKYARLAIDRGLAVHMDKPGGADLGEFEELISEIKKKNAVFHTGYMYRYNPAVIKLKQDVAEGKLGGIYSVEAHMNILHPPAKRQWLGNFPGGMMFFLGCHLVDLVCMFQGIPEQVVPFNTVTGFNGVTAEDCAFAVMKYKNGVSFVKTSAIERGGYRRRQLVVNGEKGSVQILPLEASLEGAGGDIYAGVREAYDERRSSVNYDGIYHMTDGFDRYENMMRGFASFIRRERENPYTPDYELAVYRTVLRACGVKVD